MALSTVSGGAGMAADALGNAVGKMQGSMASQGISGDYFKDGGNKSGQGYQHDKLSGK